MAAGVERDGLVEQGARLGGERLDLGVAREGQAVVEDLGRARDQVEGAVGVRLGQRVAILREPPAERGEGARGRPRVALVERQRVAQAHAQIVVSSGIVCHLASFPPS